MVNDPSVDALTAKLAENDESGEALSKYALCVIASKRARQIIERDRSGANVTPSKEKEVVRACEEIMDGKVTYTKD